MKLFAIIAITFAATSFALPIDDIAILEGDLPHPGAGVVGAEAPAGTEHGQGDGQGDGQEGGNGDGQGDGQEADTAEAIESDVVLEPNMTDQTLKNVISWIRTKVTEARLPFCWRHSYGRGVGRVPGRPANCPAGYQNHGLTCHRPAHSIAAASFVANCPEGYTNMGLTCFKGLKTYGKCCTVAWSPCPCRAGWVNMGCHCHQDAHSLGTGSMSCPSGYFVSKWTGRCHKICPEGYRNTGETCYRGPHNNAEFRCNPGEILARTQRCFPGNGDTCEAHEELDGDLCYEKCQEGYHGVGPVCWQHCPASPKPWVGCGAGCGSDAAECAMAITNQIIAPLVLAANIATFGFAEQVHSITASAQAAAKTVMISNKFFRAVGKVGRFLVKAVKSLKKLGEKIGRPILKKVTRLSNRMYNKFRASSPKWLSKLTRKLTQSSCTGLSCMDDWIAESDVSIFKRMWEKKHGTTTAKVNDVRKTISEATEASDMYATAFVEDFVQQTSQEINDAIDHRFTPFVADFIKRTWAMDQLVEMSEANHWGIAQSALAAAAIVDPTGVMGVVDAYAKPVCKEKRELPSCDEAPLVTHNC